MSNKLNTHKTLSKFNRMKNTILRKVANNTVNYFQDVVFDTQGAAIGSRWKQSERAKKRGGITLVSGGKGSGGAGGKGRRSISAKINGDTARIAPSVKYMEYHQIGAGNNPVRQFMGNSNQLLKQNERIINKEMAKL